MNCRKLLLLILGIILIVWFSVGCSTPKTTPIPPTTSLTPEPPTSTQTSIPTFTPTVGPGGFPRRLHVDGNSFVDQYGQKVVLRGMASPDPVQQAMRNNPNLSFWNEQYYQAMASWGANIIRVPITPYSIHQYGMNQVLRILDQTIAWAGENRMYVIIDFHSVGWLADGWFPPGGNETTLGRWTDFWQTISSRYANNDVVAFYELFNEPALNSHWPYTREDWLTWKSLVEPLINGTIRPNDPDKIILVGGLQSSYNLSFTADAPVRDISNNVAYATHPYSSQFIPPANYATKSGWDVAFGDLSNEYPVFATEFGYEQGLQYADDPLIDGIPYHQAIVDYLEAHHMSWAAWCFDADWQTRLLKNNQTYEPSPSGEYFRSRLLELNPHS
jgi:endoglucanase